MPRGPGLPIRYCQMNILILLSLLAIFVGSTALYLAAAQQGWLVRPLSAGPARLVAVALLVLGGWGLSLAMQRLTAIFVFASALMLACTLLPYLGALGRIRRGA